MTKNQNTEELKVKMMNPENLGKAYMMAKKMLAAQYGEAFTALSEVQQAMTTGKVLAELLDI